MAALADRDEYRHALRARLLGLTLTAEQIEVLEAGRVDAGLREGCYPWPADVVDAIAEGSGRTVVAVAFEPPPEPRPARRDRYDPTVEEQVREAGRVPTRPVRQWRD